MIKGGIEKLVGEDLYDLMYKANRVREKYHGNKIKTCSIVNAKSGRCGEDCRFCAQSGHNSADVSVYELMDPEKILVSAKDAEKNGAGRFGIVTSGCEISGKEEWEIIYAAIKLLRLETSLKIDASLGTLDIGRAKALKEAGLTRYHHNLETSPLYFPNICSTHSFNDRISTARVVKEAGLELCCGALFGMGEKWDDRIDLAVILKDLRPDSVPLNFLNPIKGTPLEAIQPLPPREILRIIAIYRIVLEDIDISICGGREKNLRDLQSWMFYAGANATMLGNYLTTIGRAAEDDRRMIEDLGLKLL